jgi:hypothetical protein
VGFFGFVWLLLPETRGRSLEEVDRLFATAATAAATVRDAGPAGGAAREHPRRRVAVAALYVVLAVGFAQLLLAMLIAEPLLPARSWRCEVGDEPGPGEAALLAACRWNQRWLLTTVRPHSHWPCTREAACIP